MRTARQLWRGLKAAAFASLVLCFASACKPAAPPAGPPKPVKAAAKPALSVTNHVAAEYVSVFEQLMPPKGTDPFFPNSHRRDPVPAAAAGAGKPPETSELALKGIVGPVGHRLAIINTAILETGEEETLRVPSGRVRLRCVEIGEDYAVIKVEGVIQPKRLELNKKSF